MKCTYSFVLQHCSFKYTNFLPVYWAANDNANFRFILLYIIKPVIAKRMKISLWTMQCMDFMMKWIQIIKLTWNFYFLCYLTISKDLKHEADIKIRKFVLNLPTPSSFVFFISTFFNCSFYNSRKCFMEKQLWCESLVWNLLCRPI